MSNPSDKPAATPPPPVRTTPASSPPRQTTSTPPPPEKSTLTPLPPCSASAQHGTSAPHPADAGSAPLDTPRRKHAPPQRSSCPTGIPAGPVPEPGASAVLRTLPVSGRMSPPLSRTCYGSIGSCIRSRPESTDAEWEEEAAPASDGGDSPVSPNRCGPEEELVATEVRNLNKSHTHV